MTSNGFSVIARPGSQTRRYAAIGVAFGVLFPLVAALLKIAQEQLPLNLSSFIAVQQSEVLLWIIDTAPLFLGLAAGLAGSRQDILIATNEKLLGREKEISSTNINLEQRVVERTQVLEETTAQMRASAYFARQIAELQDISTLLDEAVNLITKRFGHYHSAIFLLDDSRKSAFLQAASSDAGKKMLEDGYRVAVGDKGVVGRVAEQGKSYSITSSDDHSFRNPEMPRTRSQIALPLLVRGQMIGVLDIHSEQPHAFGQNEMEIFQLLADQIAISISNIRLLNESRAFVRQLEEITSRQTREVWQEFLKDKKPVYQFTPTGIRSIQGETRQKEGNVLIVPLILRGQEIGSINVKRKDESQWVDAERDLAGKIATQVALALENSRLLDETRQRAVQEQTVNEISARFSRSLDVDALLQTAARELGALPEVAEISVFIGGEYNNASKAAMEKAKG